MIRLRANSQKGQPKSLAEIICNEGRSIRRHMRCGAGIEEAAKALHLSPAACAIALRFCSSSDLLKLRAMVEDWSLPRIVVELGLLQPSGGWDPTARAQPMGSKERG